MKRPRSTSPASDRSVPDNSDQEDSLGSPSDSRSSSSSSSLSSRRDSGGEEPDKEPLWSLLERTLAVMQPEETVAGTLRRLSESGATADFNALTELHSACHAQYDLVLMSMKREALLLRAVAERTKDGQGLPPTVWFLRWKGNPTVQGPFSAQQIEQWAKCGFFEKRSATVLNGSEVNGQWKDAAQLFPRAHD